MDLSQVSRTAILTLICHAVEAEKKSSGFNDPMAGPCLERLLSIASEEEKRWIIRRKRTYEGIGRRDAKAVTRRVKAFDNAADRFIADHPKCTVINLACGFDTRFWRIENEKCKYIEIDLPEVIELKKEILKDHLGYEVIGSSVLDTSWIDKVTINGNTDFLLLAEGLFMWFPPPEAARLFKEIGERFVDRSLSWIRSLRNTQREYGNNLFACTPELIGAWMWPGILASRIHMILKLMERVSK